ncbi:unnamed protein product, partial [Sphacelaria rigidula]
PKRTTVCCRKCNGEYHPGCVGFNPAARLYPPPQWVCPLCEGGTRGQGKLHAYFQGKGTKVHGDQPWCPICFKDNRRELTKAEAKGGRKWRACPGATHCPGCNLITHPACVAALPKRKDGTWPCPECKVRRLGRLKRHTAVAGDGRGEGTDRLGEEARNTPTLRPPPSLPPPGSTKRDSLSPQARPPNYQNVASRVEGGRSGSVGSLGVNTMVRGPKKRLTARMQASAASENNAQPMPSDGSGSGGSKKG